MFDDIISRDENVILKALENDDSALLSWHSTFYTKLEDFLSKDSETFQYNYGRINGTVPERATNFLNAYPKKATNLDTDYHHYTFDMEMTRWISRDTLKIFVPILYFQDLQKKKKAEALFAKSVPTSQELELCNSLRGTGYYKRNGSWHCTTVKLALDSKDDYGPNIFQTYNEWIAWESKIQSQIHEAKLQEDWTTVLKLRKLKSST